MALEVSNGYNKCMMAALPSSSPESVVAMPLAPSTPQPCQQQLAFLQTWRESIQPRLSQLLALLGNQEVAKNLALAQIFTYLPVLTEGRQYLAAEPICLLGNPALQDFHNQCCQQGLSLTRLGPMGKVWESGVVQVVQQADNLPTDSHPVDRLPGPVARVIGEIVYLPVYDAIPGSATQGVVAAVELMTHPQGTDVMVVANTISCMSEIMASLGLALSIPVQLAAGQQQEQRPDIERHSAPPSMREDHASSSFQSASSSFAGASSFGSGGKLARKPSVRTFF